MGTEAEQTQDEVHPPAGRNAPHLTSHLRALALLEPLHRAEDSKGLLHLGNPGVVVHIDMRYLALAVIELLIERMGLGGTASRHEMIEHLVELARVQCDELTDDDAGTLAAHVFDVLTNARDRRARFRTRLFEPRNANPVLLEFALLRAEPLADSTVGYRLTQEAIEVHLNLLAQDPMTATQVNELIVEEYLRRGLYDEAANAAQRARTNSIRLSEALRTLMATAQRAIRKVLWQEEIGPRLEEARAFLETSIAREGALLLLLSDTAGEVSEQTDRQHIARLRQLLIDVQNRHRNLIVVIQGTATDYLQLQAETLKRLPLSRLPDLEREILEPCLGASLERLSDAAPQIFSVISGALSPMVFDVGAVLEGFAPDLDDEDASEMSSEVAPPSAPRNPTFADELIEQVGQFARSLLRERGTLTLSDILEIATQEGNGNELYQRCLFLTLEQAIDPRTGDIASEALILDTRFDGDFVTGRNVRYAGAANTEPDSPRPVTGVVDVEG